MNGRSMSGREWRNEEDKVMNEGGSEEIEGKNEKEKISEIITEVRKDKGIWEKGMEEGKGEMPCCQDVRGTQVMSKRAID